MNPFFRIVAVVLGCGFVGFGVLVALTPVLGARDWLFAGTAVVVGAFLIISPKLYPNEETLNGGGSGSG